MCSLSKNYVRYPIVPQGPSYPNFRPLARVGKVVRFAVELVGECLLLTHVIFVMLGGVDLPGLGGA